ncbi:unnamed protein product [Paramecium sonneborni]|uniref:C3H1-type domain-containing protein n=1 Tax=Paramecium sonneborni TaxID=65129 RepID=A0A8S1MVK7_9CILI|nr:unnamed protein product [Paramecium sonneborni]
MAQNPILNHQIKSTDHSFDSQSEGEQEDSFELVEKKIKNKKSFLQEEPKKKKKEICRNYQIMGICKYREQCFYAHSPSYSQITAQPKVLTKIKPCKRYFNGICYFGQKCQFLHYECIDVIELREFVEKQYKEQKLIVPLNPSFNLFNQIAKLDQNIRFDLQRFHHLYKIFGRKLNFKRDDLIINSSSSRLNIFISICKQQDRFEQLLMSNNTSRKESEQS